MNPAQKSPSPFRSSEKNLSRLGLTLWMIATRLGKERIHFEDRFGLFSYARWLRTTETSGAQTRKQPADLRRRDSARIAVILLAGETAPEPAEAVGMLRSLLSQTASNWEAYLETPQQCEEPFREAIAQMGNDPRIHLKPQTRGGLVSRVKETLEDSPAARFVLLEWGDRLSQAFFSHSLELLDRAADCDILYWDEDQAADEERSFRPWFKPDWSPELLISANFLRHALFRSEILDNPQIATADPADVEQLTFLIAEKARRIEHIPQVGVHCGCGARQIDQHRLPAVIAHMCRAGIEAGQAAIASNGQIQVSWPVEGKPVSIVIPTRDRLPLLQRCLSSIEGKTRYVNYEILVADTGSQEAETPAYYRSLETDPRVRVLFDPEPFNFSQVNNWAARQARGNVFVFLNNDVEAIEGDWLEELVRWAERPGIGIVGGKLLYPSGSLQHAGIVMGMEGHASHVFSRLAEGATGPFGSSDWYRDLSAVTGACMAMRREVFEEIGGFDERFRIAFGDVEICQRAIRHGYRVLYNPFARLIHHEGMTRAHFIPAEDTQVAAEEFQRVVQAGDPYYNPNLSYSVRVPTLRRAWEETPAARLAKIVAASRMKE